MMIATAPLAADQIRHLRRAHYNAEVIRLERVHDDLMIMRIHPDRGIPPFRGGQYTVLGLGYWEPRLQGTQCETVEEDQLSKIIRRAYSISCPLLDDEDRLLRVSELPYLEFYVALVREADRRPPALTPRLFLLEEGSRLLFGPHIHGHYTLARVRGDQDVVFVATGTGEAPHNAMLGELFATGHRGQIASVVCVRHRRDLAYLDVHRRLERLYPNYRYLPLTTREPENLDPSVPGYVGKRYVQDYFASGDFQQEADMGLDPAATHVFLCGNPDMIGVPLQTHDLSRRYPQPTGMVEVLERCGLHVDRPHEPGNIHFEKYW